MIKLGLRTFFRKFADNNSVLCFLVVKELRAAQGEEKDPDTASLMLCPNNGSIPTAPQTLGYWNCVRLVCKMLIGSDRHLQLLPMVVIQTSLIAYSTTVDNERVHSGRYS